MSSKTALRIAVLAEWALRFAALALSAALADSLPPPLRDFLDAEGERPAGVLELAVLPIAVLVVGSAVVSSVGLLFLRRWARWLYLASLAIGTAFLPLLGPTVEHAVADMVDETSITIGGLILGIAFFGDAFREVDLDPRVAAPARSDEP